MGDLQSIADRVEIEALRGEFVDAGVMRDYDRFASLFTHDGAWRMPHVPADLIGREQIRAWAERAQEDVWEYFVQTTHAGTIELADDAASGRAYVFELMHGHDGSSQLHHSLYHDRYRRTAEGWKFVERVYELRYLDTTPLAGSTPDTVGAP